jgi:hypothetical protein
MMIINDRRVDAELIHVVIVGGSQHCRAVFYFTITTESLLVLLLPRPDSSAIAVVSTEAMYSIAMEWSTVCRFLAHHHEFCVFGGLSILLRENELKPGMRFQS